MHTSVPVTHTLLCVLCVHTLHIPLNNVCLPTVDGGLPLLLHVQVRLKPRKCQDCVCAVLLVAMLAFNLVFGVGHMSHVYDSAASTMNRFSCQNSFRYDESWVSSDTQTESAFMFMFHHKTAVMGMLTAVFVIGLVWCGTLACAALPLVWVTGA